MKHISRFEISAPAAQGLSAAAIREWLTDWLADDLAQEIHAFALLRRGKLLAEGAFAPFRLEDEHELFSGTKMFIGVAFGFAKAEGRIDENELVKDLLGDCLPSPLPDEFSTLAVRHLLSMTAGFSGKGVHKVTAFDGQTDHRYAHLREVLSRPFAHAPGEVFSYDNECSYLLSAILQRKTGETVQDYLTPRLFSPLHIPTPSFGADADGINYGYMGVRLSIEQYAALGELFRLDGVWEGKRILPEGFCAMATAKRAETPPMPGKDWGEGYALHFWRGKHSSFRFCGAYGQMCAVFPKEELVLAVFSGCDYFNIPHVLESFYDKVLCRLSPIPLPEEKEEEAKLRLFTQGLRLGNTYSETPVSMLDFANQQFTFEQNAPYETVTISHASDSLTVTLSAKDTSVCFAAGLRAPIRTVIPEARSRFPYPTERHDTVIAASAHFPTPRTLVIRMHFLHTPYAMTLSLDLSDKTVTVTRFRF